MNESCYLLLNCIHANRILYSQKCCLKVWYLIWLKTKILDGFIYWSKDLFEIATLHTGLFIWHWFVYIVKYNFVIISRSSICVTPRFVGDVFSGNNNWFLIDLIFQNTLSLQFKDFTIFTILVISIKSNIFIKCIG